MTGRGVDQILPHPGGHQIFEPYVQDAREYVALAESRNGPISEPVAGSYIWGDALAELARVAPDVRIINLETSITVSDGYWKGKGINYRMHPENIECLTAARVDVCALANNHVLDYGYAGLAETLETLRRAGLKGVGAGPNAAAARAPAVVAGSNGPAVVVFSFASETSGVPRDWAALKDRPGVDLLPDLSESSARQVVERVRQAAGEHDLAVASIHWGGNWGYEVPRQQVRFAHWLVLMYFATLSAAAGDLVRLQMTPMQIRKMRLNSASSADATWLRDTLERVSAPFGTHVEVTDSIRLLLRGA
jgi:poly-gamma-glutamate synthesis protein (capsule biosynthesis protein)